MAGQKTNNKLPTKNYQQLLVSSFKSVIRKLTIRSSNLLVDNRSFTLVELLVVIALIAVLAVAVILSLNPSELLKQGRDSTRLSDLQNLNRSLSWFNADTGGTGFMGSSSVIYVSIPDTTSTCANLGLPTPPPGWSYHCVTQENLQKTDGSGWIPVNFNQISFGKTLTKLPIDPINQTSTGNYYTYVAGGSWKLTTRFESQKYTLQFVAQDGGPDPALYELGSNLNLAPFVGGLVGYWSFDEGSGTTAYDYSGYGNNAILATCCGGTTTPTWDYGKKNWGVKLIEYPLVQTPQYIQLPQNMFSTTSLTLIAWIKPDSDSGGYNATFQICNINAYGQYLGYSNSGIVIDSWGGKYRAILNGWYYDPPDLFSNQDPLYNDWQMISFTYNINNSNVSLYFNSSKIASNNISTPINFICSTNANIIGYIMWHGLGFKGIIDEVRIYNRALSDAEIQAIYNATK
jgi:type II secretory pathway pseudopilin PulG